MKRKKYLTREEKTNDFVIGFGGFFVLNWAIYSLLLPCVTILTAIVAHELGGTGELIERLNFYVMLFLPPAVNIGLFIFFAWWRQRIALGALSALGSLIILAILAGVCFLLACFTILAIASPAGGT